MLLYLLLFLLVGACGQTDSDHAHDEHDHHSTEGMLELNDLQAVEFGDRQLQVVATTSIIRDVVANIAGDTIDLVVLIGRNKDPHSYEPTPQDFVALEEADVIFVNGWHLEEQIADVVDESFEQKAVAISAEISPRQFDSHATDPHVWFSIHNVEQWAQNVEQILSQLDPENATIYAENLATYEGELESLMQEVDTLLTELPTEKRKLVTNHDAFGYFADEYDFEVVGTVIPSFSTSAEPSATDLANLVEVMEREGVCTVFGEVSQNEVLAETISAELTHCDTVQLLSLYTGAIGDGEADSYIGIYRANVKTIVEGLR